ncbi:MAG: SDR family oxidoreductase [Rhodospirillales bacterium]|nr:SDR family oxidoreductase [Rhodospirillales bacterium]
MPTVLVTGAGRGLGLEFARQYAAAKWRVIGTVRDVAKGAKLSTLGGAVEVRPCDMTDRPGIARLGRDLKDEKIDVLLCNAGVYGPRDGGFGETNYDAWLEALQVNLMAPMAMAEAFVEQVAASARKTMIVISTGMASIAEHPGGAYVYRSSKAALNSVGRGLARDLAGRGVIVVMVHPGWVRTDMGGASATLSPEESVRHLRTLIERLRPVDSGKFCNYDGTEIPW